ncbi:MAG TPA: hypothetical protein P5191_06745 [Ruminococcus sp.]|nr:hypothetical protein [Ruminococcus sp.]
MEMPIWLPEIDGIYKLKDIEANDDFAPLQYEKLEIDPDEYSEYNTIIKLGNENADENYTNRGVMFILVYESADYSAGFEGDWWMFAQHLSLWPDSYPMVVNADNGDVPFAIFNYGESLVAMYGFSEQPQPYGADSFVIPYNGKCGITWTLLFTIDTYRCQNPTVPQKQVLCRRPVGASEDTSWGTVEIEGYYCDYGKYVFEMYGTNEWQNYECFIRVWDNNKKYEAEAESNCVCCTHNKDYIDSDIFVVEMQGPDPRIMVDTYKANGTYPTQEGKVFAGWYAAPDFTMPYTESTGYAFAKFVDEDVNKVMAQLASGTTADSEKTDIRFVTTIDDLNYKNVGFLTTLGGKTANVKTTDAYKEVNGGGNAYVPTAFSEESNWFVTYLLKNVPNIVFYKEFKVQAYWTTLDGTVVTGKEKAFKVNEHFN